MRSLHLVATAALTLIVASCGSATSDTTTTIPPTSTTSVTSTTTIPETTTTTTTTAPATTTTTAPATTTTTTPPPTGLEQPAIWPAPGVVFTDPVAAATDFVTKVFGVPANLGEFQQGDSRSGEIEVLSPGEGSAAPVVRSVLLLRQLGPDDGWFVLAAVNDKNTITVPASGSSVAAGPIEVAGQGRGFEGLLIVDAYVAGNPNLLDRQLAQGGSAEDPEPFSVTLDLSGTASGDTVILLVKGGVGLETDTGEFSAIPVTIP